MTWKIHLSLVFLAPITALAAPVDFVRDIQPIFEENCFDCHGSHKQEAAFRLDHKPSAFEGGDFGKAIIPGDAENSRLIHAVEGRNPKMRMPRKRDPLSAAQIALLNSWIDSGADWPDSASVVLHEKKDHWSFKPPVKAPLPKVAGAPTAIDAFIGARLEKEGLDFSPEADRPTLIRRLYLDLTGLPPSPAEVDAFVADSSPNAYKTVVERLLASPHYGERWGRHWLDAARYADTNGFEKDPFRSIWFYRDWVTGALNRDLPYDQFIIEQIAGDQLPKPTQAQIVATGFLRNSMINEEGGIDPEQFRMEGLIDRMDAIGKSILGLTTGCTQCHDHKYDPIKQEEYYGMMAFLNNDNEPSRVVYTPDEQLRLAEMHRGITAIEAELKHRHPTWQKEMATWEKTVAMDQPEWTIIAEPTDGSGGQKLILQKDGSYLAQGYAPTKMDTDLEFPVKAGTTITAIRLELLKDANLPAYGPGRSYKGLCALSEFTAELNPTGEEKKPTPLKVASATADFGEPENTPLDDHLKDKDAAKDTRTVGPVSYAIDGDIKTAWGIDAGPGRRNDFRNAVFTLAEPITVKSDRTLKIKLSQKHGGWNGNDLTSNNLGRFRLAITDAPAPKADPVPKAVRQILAIPAAKRSTAQMDRLFAYWRTTVPAFASSNAKVESLWKTHPEGTTTLVLDSRDEPRMTHILKRGDFTKPGDTVGTLVPAALNPLPKNADSSRLTFAKWLVAADAPTTARAFVNRVWQAYFGTGLVDTPEDLGVAGSLPTHPELLDWLAATFMDTGWGVKDLHRLILNSRTYRQSSRVTPEHLEKDPFNRLLARGPRARVEGEIVRDLQLAISGLLNPEIGGAPVRPPAPVFLFEPPASYGYFDWTVDEGPQRYRRSLYTLRRRSTPYPFLSTFDAPTGEASCIQRARSNTPLQALMTLNETLSMEAARALGDRLIAEGGNTAAQRIRYGFKLCTAREPTAKESAALQNLIQRQQRRALTNTDIAQALVGKDTQPGDLAERAAYTIVARTLLNLDETITKE